MTERKALLQAVCTAPDDDLPRLVFADWVQENGEPERAEFIRVMCRLEELYTAIERGAGPPAVAEMNRLDPRAWELWQTHGGAWLGELPKLVGITWPDGRWRRGFAGGVVAETVGDFLRAADTVAVTVPLAGLEIRRVRGVTALLKCPHLRTVRVLTMAGAGVTDRMTDELCRSDALDGLKLLDLKYNRLSANGVRRLERKFGPRVSAVSQLRR